MEFLISEIYRIHFMVNQMMTLRNIANFCFILLKKTFRFSQHNKQLRNFLHTFFQVFVGKQLNNFFARFAFVIMFCLQPYTKLNGVDLLGPVFPWGSTDTDGKSMTSRSFIGSLSSGSFVTSRIPSQSCGKKKQKCQKHLFFVSYFDDRLHDPVKYTHKMNTYGFFLSIVDSISVTIG